MGKSFINIKFLWVSFLAFTALTVYRQQVTSNRTVTPPFKIEAVEVNRLSWDQVEIIPDYTFDYVSADFGITSKIMEEVTVFDALGKSIYTGINERAFNIPDAELGSEEPLTIKYCLTKSRKTACQETKIKASPKKLDIKPTITYPHNNRIFLGVFNLNATLMRQVYDKTDDYEPIKSSLENLKSVLKLMPKGSEVSVSLPVTGNTGQFDLSEIENYHAFKKEMQQRIYDENLEFDFEIITEFGDTKTAYPERLREALEKEAASVEEPLIAEAIEETETIKEEVKEVVEAPKEIATLTLEIPKGNAPKVDKPSTKEIVKPEAVATVVEVEVVEEPINLHVPFERKYDLFETPPPPAIMAYDVALLVKEEARKEEEKKKLKATEVLADAAKLNKVVKTSIPVPTKKEIKEAKKEVAVDVASIASNFANKIQMNVIRMVHEDPIISKNSKIRSYKFDKKTGKLRIDLTVKWVDRWMEETYSVEGILTVGKDGKNANFRITGKNQNVIDLEEFTAQRAKPSLYLKSL